MSIQRIGRISKNISNIIIHVQSPSLEYYIKTKLKERFNVHRDFIIDARTQKELHNAKLDSFVAPLLCDKWLIHVNADDLPLKDSLQAIDKNSTVHGITVYWTTKYMIYKKLTDSTEVQKQGIHCQDFSFSRVDKEDINYLHKEMVPEEKRLTKPLQEYVSRNYRFDVQSACDLYAQVRSGSEIKNKRDIIEAVGLGGNTVANLLVRVLTAHPDTGRKLKNTISTNIRMLEDLSVTYKYNTIRNYALNAIDGFIEMKQLQILGIYGRLTKEVPDSYDTKRLSILRRFDRAILNDVSLPRLLNLKMCLLTYNDYDARISLIQAFSEFHSNNAKSLLQSR